MELRDAKATTRAVCNVKTSNQFQKSMNVRLTNVNDETAIETTEIKGLHHEQVSHRAMN